jgi:hypothetical protein
MARQRQLNNHVSDRRLGVSGVATAPPNVALWHKADITRVLSNVRFCGQSGHDADLTRCPLLTHSGHVQLKSSAVQYHDCVAEGSTLYSDWT